MGRRTKIALAAAAVPLVALVVIGVEVLVTLNRDYLRTADFEVDFTTEGERPPIKMAVLGDSLVEGVGASSERTSLAGQVAIKVSEQTGRAVDVRAFGVTGAETEDVVEKQLPQLEPGEYDVIVLEIGSNDATGWTPLSELEESTRKMLERAIELAPIVVFGGSGRLDTPNFPRPLRDIIVWRATQVRELQAVVAADFEDVDYMNVAKDVSPLYSRTPGANSADDFHPSDIGYEIWARPLAELVVERIESSEGV